jgi:molybdopterin-guanine dinucleotide biosynthesis protein
MALIVVGGQSRNLGKTSLVAGLISALPEYGWTAVKITQFGHGICSVNGKSCHCAVDEHRWAITEERDRSGKTDTSRFLAAGAAQSLWVRTKQGRLEEAMPKLREKLGAARSVIVESNSIMGFLRPDLYLTVLDPGKPDFKASALKFLELADAVVAHAGAGTGDFGGRPLFRITPPEYVTQQIVEWVKGRLERRQRQAGSTVSASKPGHLA